MSKVKVGLFGGTFNPIHLGHLRGAEEVRELLGLEKVYFIPSAVPPHKKLCELAPQEHRLNMVRLAVSGNPFFEVSEIEIERGGPSYTVDTLEYFLREFPDFNLYFIIGTDSLVDIDTWKDYKELSQLSNFAVLARPGAPRDFPSLIPLALRASFRYYKREEGVTFYVHEGSNLLVFVEIEGLEVSSTRIRDLISRGKSIKYLVPGEVEDYILSNKLYVYVEEETSL